MEAHHRYSWPPSIAIDSNNNKDSRRKSQRARTTTSSLASKRTRLKQRSKRHSKSLPLSTTLTRTKITLMPPRRNSRRLPMRMRLCQTIRSVAFTTNKAKKVWDSTSNATAKVVVSKITTWTMTTSFLASSEGVAAVAAVTTSTSSMEAAIISSSNDRKSSPICSKTQTYILSTLAKCSSSIVDRRSGSFTFSTPSWKSAKLLRTSMSM